MNVFWRTRPMRPFADEFVAERSRLLAERLAPFDVICLNEAFHFGPRTVANFISTIICQCDVTLN
jgi:hypothetical protein